MTTSRTIVRSVLPAALLGASLLCGPPAVRADDGAEFESAVRELFGRKFAHLAFEDAQWQAKSARELHISGREHLAGRVFASRLTIDAGAEVTVAPGTLIYVAGDMTIDAPLVMTQPQASFEPKKGTPVPTGAPGASVASVSMVCGGDGSLGALEGVDGGAGADIVVNPGAEARGGVGGTGGGFSIVCKGSLALSGAVRPGRGGRGGRGEAHGEPGSAPGASGKDVHKASGGDGGNAGAVAISAADVTITGTIRLSGGGDGGVGDAHGGDGLAGGPCGKGGDGGSATAIGGNAGRSTSVVFVGRTRLVAGLPGTEADAAGLGGSAFAAGGAAGGGGACVPAEACPGRGRKGARGGAGGAATARGGVGGSSAQVRVQGSVVAEGPAGAGGIGEGDGGAGGAGSAGESAKGPGAGGDGGKAGAVTARGGPGGRTAVVSAAGGAGGNAQARPKPGGAAGAGGSCCDNPGGSGAPGGRPGAAAKSSAKGGTGGDGVPVGTKGNELALPGVAGAEGAAGTNCPPPGGLAAAGKINEFPVGPPMVGKGNVVDFHLVSSTGARSGVFTASDGKVEVSRQNVTVPAGDVGVVVQVVIVPPKAGERTLVVKFDGQVILRFTFTVLPKP